MMIINYLFKIRDEFNYLFKIDIEQNCENVNSVKIDIEPIYENIFIQFFFVSFSLIRVYIKYNTFIFYRFYPTSST